MDSQSLTPEQADSIRLEIGKSLNYLHRLRRRMEQTGFPPSDSLYRAVVAAQDAMASLHVDAHYLSCRSGVGRKPRG